jgi:hypothetical protein
MIARVTTRLGAGVTAMLVVLAPALWNGFPFLQFDTGGYIARWYEGTLEVSRSTVYGLFLDLLAQPDFWPAVIVQVAVAIWMLALAMRVYGFAGPLRLVLTVAMLCVLTTLPWLADILITDIFAGLSVLALHLLVLRGDDLGRFERAALLVLIAFAAASHSGTLGVLMVLIAAGCVAALYDPRLVSARRLLHATLALALGALMLLGADYVVAKRFTWTPGGIALSFGRLLQDGIVAKFLDEHCPDPRFRLCDHRAELTRNADYFFWGQSLFDRLGRFQGMHDEMETIVVESLGDYPLLQIEDAAAATVAQLGLVRTGYGVVTSIWHTYAMIERCTPAALRAMRAAHQQRGDLDAVLTAINRIHVPVALASTLLLFGVIAFGLGRRDFSDLALLAVTVALAILANAVVFGVLSGPHDRYGARLPWVATFVLLMVGWRAVPRARGTILLVAQALAVNPEMVSESSAKAPAGTQS